ncbi:unknown [Clostridium sp. CAG:264]|jgi:hypothetical protein|uniref:hypothetical protein n=1 Tax=Coprococcus sp. TaxID=2049024 RepID=UPI00033DB00C|nr:unknown [Clostridium sp. CAG:264]
MQRLSINTDPQKLYRSTIPTFKSWQMMCLAVILVGIVMIVIFLNDRVSATISGFAVALVVVVPGYIAMFNHKGLDFLEYHKKKYGRHVFYYENEPIGKGGR